jgi:hypothetical protein
VGWGGVGWGGVGWGGVGWGGVGWGGVGWGGEVRQGVLQQGEGHRGGGRGAVGSGSAPTASAPTPVSPGAPQRGARPGAPQGARRQGGVHRDARGVRPAQAGGHVRGRGVQSGRSRVMWGPAAAQAQAAGPGGVAVHGCLLREGVCKRPGVPQCASMCLNVPQPRPATQVPHRAAAAAGRHALEGEWGASGCAATRPPPRAGPAALTTAPSTPA